MLHGEQRLRLHRPMPTRGTAEIRAHVSKLWDKGAGAIVDTTAEVTVDGQLVATTTYGSFVRGGGGFGGERGKGLSAPERRRRPGRERDRSDPAPAGPDLPAHGRHQPPPRRPGLRPPRRPGAADPARPLHLRVRDPARDPPRGRRRPAPRSSASTPASPTWSIRAKRSRSRSGARRNVAAYVRVSVAERGVTVIDPLLISLAP